MSRPRLELKLGAEPKKVALLVALLAVAGYFFWQNSTDAQPTARAPQPQASGTRPAAKPASGAAPVNVAKKETGARREFRPSLAPRKDEDRSVIDPTLRLDLLARLERVRFDSAGRNLFEFGPVEAPRPKLPEPKIEIKPGPVILGPEPPPAPPAPPVKPAPPPIPLKFYGLALPARGNDKRVFCLQGDEILIPAEGDLVQNRYRIVRITPASVLVEDTQFKHQQLIPIDQPPAPGG